MVPTGPSQASAFRSTILSWWLGKCLIRSGIPAGRRKQKRKSWQTPFLCHWSELCHMGLSSCKRGWEVQYSSSRKMYCTCSTLLPASVSQVISLCPYSNSVWLLLVFPLHGWNENWEELNTVFKAPELVVRRSVMWNLACMISKVSLFLFWFISLKHMGSSGLVVYTYHSVILKPS
jgi:hypothetical protein